MTARSATSAVADLVAARSSEFVEVAVGGTAAETLDNLEASVEEALAAAASADAWLAEHPPVLTWDALRLHPAATDADHPLVRDLAAAHKEMRGTAATVTALSAVTDMRHLVRHGGVPTVTFGPGEMRVAHTDDEELDLDEFLTAVEVLARCVIRRCAA